MSRIAHEDGKHRITHCSLRVLKPLLVLVLLTGRFTATLLPGPAHAGVLDGLLDALDPVKRRQSAYARTEDKELVNAFYVISDGSKDGVTIDLKDHVKVADVSASDMALKRQVASGANLPMAKVGLDDLRFDAERDPVVVKYIGLATARGNSIRVYRPALTRMIAIPLGLADAGSSRQAWLDKEPVFIEYSTTGRPVSVLILAYLELPELIGVQISRYYGFYFGQTAVQFVEYKLSANDLQNNFIRAISSPAVAVAPAVALPATVPSSSSMLPAAVVPAPMPVPMPSPVAAPAARSVPMLPLNGLSAEQQKIVNERIQAARDQLQAQMQGAPATQQTPSASKTSPIEARKELAAMGLTYHSQDQFIAAVKRDDVIAVKLFIQAQGVKVAQPDSQGVTAGQVATSVELKQLLTGGN